MHISDVLHSKGDAVVTVTPSSSVSALLAELTAHNVGAAVVLDGEDIVGIVSERDVVRHLHTRGAELLTASVAQIMTCAVRTCSPEDTLDSVSVMMPSTAPDICPW